MDHSAGNNPSTHWTRRPSKPSRCSRHEWHPSHRATRGAGGIMSGHRFMAFLMQVDRSCLPRSQSRYCIGRRRLPKGARVYTEALLGNFVLSRSKRCLPLSTLPQARLADSRLISLVSITSQTFMSRSLADQTERPRCRKRARSAHQPRD